MVADEKRRDLLAGLSGLHHVLHEVVVGIALVGKAPAVARHRDDARLGAVDEMRHHALAMPSLRVVIDTGTQAAAFGSVSSTWPPAVSASRKPSPVLPVGPGE